MRTPLRRSLRRRNCSTASNISVGRTKLICCGSCWPLRGGPWHWHSHWRVKLAQESRAPAKVASGWQERAANECRDDPRGGLLQARTDRRGSEWQLHIPEGWSAWAWLSVLGRCFCAAPITKCCNAQYSCCNATKAWLATKLQAACDSTSATGGTLLKTLKASARTFFMLM